MGLVKFLKFLRLKVWRRRVGERVAAIDEGGKEMIVLCWQDIERLTMNLSTLIGHGGFSKVYLARFPDSSTAAVKIQCCTTQRLHQAYKHELQILLHLHHPNIVKLLGHCHYSDREEGILILEHAPNGNLHEKLDSQSSNKSRGLSWKKRMAIAFQLAQALDYLHKSNIIHGDIKASNILLDDHLNTKLCDFGSSNSQFSPSNNNPNNNNRRARVMHGSPGYTDPHYLKTGVPSQKNDVYSFGVIVLELITGMQALDPLTGERLTSRVDPILVRDGQWREKVVRIVDPRVTRGDVGFELEEALAMAELAAMCLCDSPIDRPSLSHILASMRNKISCI
ncbi:hypothetical protein ACS0TY_011452 [Phlomoides rotata]